MTEQWTKKLKRGAYRKHLKRLGLINDIEKIPLSLSRMIASAKTGSKLTYKGKKFTVTPLLKKRAETHLTLVKLARARKKKK